MGMLRLFLPNNKVQFNVETQKESVRSQVNMKTHRNYLMKFFRPREFLAEFLGRWWDWSDDSLDCWLCWQAPSSWSAWWRARPSASPPSLTAGRGTPPCWPEVCLPDWPWWWGSWWRASPAGPTWTPQSRWGWQSGVGSLSPPSPPTWPDSSSAPSPRPASSSSAGAPPSQRPAPRWWPALPASGAARQSWGWTRASPPSWWSWWPAV